MWRCRRQTLVNALWLNLAQVWCMLDYWEEFRPGVLWCLSSKQPETMSNNRAPGFQKFPDYQIQMRNLMGKLEIYCADVLIASTFTAIELLESKLKPALYVPTDAFDQACLRPSDTQTHCPFKGDASYWSVEVPGRRVKDAFWYYPQPFDEVADLSNFAGVYQDRVDQLLLDGAPWPDTHGVAG